MAIDPSDPAQQALALQMFIKNSKYVELIVDTAFVVIPALLGGGAATLIGRQAINVAREISHNFGYIRLLSTGASIISTGTSLGGLAAETTKAPKYIWIGGKRFVSGVKRLRGGGAKGAEDFLAKTGLTEKEAEHIASTLRFYEELGIKYEITEGGGLFTYGPEGRTLQDTREAYAKFYKLGKEEQKKFLELFGQSKDEKNW